MCVLRMLYSEIFHCFFFLVLPCWASPHNASCIYSGVTKKIYDIYAILNVFWLANCLFSPFSESFRFRRSYWCCNWPFFLLQFFSIYLLRTLNVWLLTMNSVNLIFFVKWFHCSIKRLFFFEGIVNWSLSCIPQLSCSRVFIFLFFVGKYNLYFDFWPLTFFLIFPFTSAHRLVFWLISQRYDAKKNSYIGKCWYFALTFGKLTYLIEPITQHMGMGKVVH